MSFIHDAIKIKYVELGYLPNYPYHMISDSEMCDGFLSRVTGDTIVGYFADTYYLPSSNVSEELRTAYNNIVSEIERQISQLKSSKDTYKLPDWIYSYMLGQVVGPESDIMDRHDLLVLMGLDNPQDDITSQVMSTCYSISTSWLNTKVVETEYGFESKYERPPAVFGETHVIKSLRLSQLKG